MNVLDVPYLLTLSENVLVGRVFPVLSLNVLDELSSAYSKFKQVCENENLWILKTQHEYPTYVCRKPNELSWKQYYSHLLSTVKYIP